MTPTETLIFISQFDWQNEVRVVIKKLKLSGKKYQTIAKELGVNPCYMSEVLNGKRPVPFYWITLVVDNYLQPSGQNLKRMKERDRSPRAVI